MCYNGKFYQNRDDYNLKQLLESNLDESFILDKLKRFKDLLSDNSNNNINNNTTTHTYYQDWLDTPKEGVSMNQNMFTTTNKQEFNDLVDELFSRDHLFKKMVAPPDTDLDFNSIEYDKSMGDQELFEKIQNKIRCFKYEMLIRDQSIDDIIKFSERVFRIADSYHIQVYLLEHLLSKTYILAIILGRIEFVKFFNQIFINNPSLDLIMHTRTGSSYQEHFLKNLALAYWYNREVYEYLCLFVDKDITEITIGQHVLAVGLDDQTKYRFYSYMVAIKRLEVDKVKWILLGIGKKDKEMLFGYNTFKLYYNTLANAKTFQEKRDLIELGKFLKSEFLKSDLVIYNDITLAFILDKEFYLKIFENSLDHKFFVKGPLMTDEFGLLKYFVEVGPDLILSIDVENIILEFALFTSGETLKPVLYLFEKWQHLIKSESILDHLMHMAVKNDNHRLINILLHRTKIRLIKPVSPQHEHQILSRMKLVLKSSRYLRPTYFQKYPNFEIDEPLLDQHIMEALGNPIDRIRFTSFEIDSDTKIIQDIMGNMTDHKYIIQDSIDLNLF